MKVEKDVKDIKKDVEEIDTSVEDIKNNTGKVIVPFNEEGYSGNVDIPVNADMENYSLLWVELGGKVDSNARRGDGSAILKRKSEDEYNICFSGFGVGSYETFRVDYRGDVTFYYNKSTKRITTISANLYCDFDMDSDIVGNDVVNFAVCAVYGIF